jgi:hypothetical protein
MQNLIKRDINTQQGKNKQTTTSHKKPKLLFQESQFEVLIKQRHNNDFL